MSFKKNLHACHFDRSEGACDPGSPGVTRFWCAGVGAEEEWRNPEDASSTMLIRGISTRALSRDVHHARL
jgi:hypothetical protein